MTQGERPNATAFVEGGVDFVANEHNAALLPPEVVAQARRLAADIVAGRIEVPSQ